MNLSFNIGVWFLSVVALWRITHLLTQEDGPFDVVYLVRKKLGSSQLGKAMDCFYCLSIWLAIPFAICLVEGVAEGILTWLSLSGAACIIQKIITNPHSKTD